LSVEESSADGSVFDVSLTKLINYYQKRYYSVKARLSQSQSYSTSKGSSPFSVRTKCKTQRTIREQQNTKDEEKRDEEYVTLLKLKALFICFI